VRFQDVVHGRSGHVRSNAVKACIETWQVVFTWLLDIAGIREELRVQRGRREAFFDCGRAAPELHREVPRRHPRRAVVDGIVVLEGQRTRREMLATLYISSRFCSQQF